jgi:hypothetical protein
MGDNSTSTENSLFEHLVVKNSWDVKKASTLASQVGSYLDLYSSTCKISPDSKYFLKTVEASPVRVAQQDGEDCLPADMLWHFDEAL